MNKKSLSLQKAWKEREGYLNGLNKSKIYNTWRAIKFTIKGKSIGFDERWNDFKLFYNDMAELYTEGDIIQRLDKSKPFNKDNCIWIPKNLQPPSKESYLNYNNQQKTLKEWCLLYDLNYNGVRQRFFKGKNYTAREVLFGRPRKLKRDLISAEGLNAQEKRNKASKMLSQYKLKDKKKGFLGFDLTIEWFIENIFNKACIYCGITKNIGADRIDNKKGHNKNNIKPCCYRCNAVRGNHFSHEQMKELGQFIRANLDKRK